MTGAEVVVLGYIVMAFVVFGVALAWVSSDSSRPSVRSAANDEARPAIAARAATVQPRRS
jgi:hypothetical protein